MQRKKYQFYTFDFEWEYLFISTIDCLLTDSISGFCSGLFVEHQQMPKEDQYVDYYLHCFLKIASRHLMG